MQGSFGIGRRRAVLPERAGQTPTTPCHHRPQASDTGSDQARRRRQCYRSDAPPPLTLHHSGAQIPLYVLPTRLAAAGATAKHGTTLRHCASSGVRRPRFSLAGQLDIVSLHCRRSHRRLFFPCLAARSSPALPHPLRYRLQRYKRAIRTDRRAAGQRLATHRSRALPAASLQRHGDASAATDAPTLDNDEAGMLFCGHDICLRHCRLVHALAGRHCRFAARARTYYLAQRCGTSRRVSDTDARFRSRPRTGNGAGFRVSGISKSFR